MKEELKTENNVNQFVTNIKSNYNEIKIEVFERRIFLKLPKNEKTSNLFEILPIQSGIQFGFIGLFRTIQEI